VLTRNGQVVKPFFYRIAHGYRPALQNQP
jgi:hypothetical protein